ncbi:hypothetical protein [Trichocoleus sp. Lan]|uniref:hypothetical protein n=1 Tax=Trichocoleus sp. Lan TaxID=2933927 RepID=UPI0032977AC8
MERKTRNWTIVRAVNRFFSLGNTGLHGTLEPVIAGKISAIGTGYAVHLLGFGKTRGDRTK